jgi:hypothetical protein
MGLSLILGVVVLFAALGVGVAVGLRRGALAGIASAAGVVALGVLGYVALVTLMSPM